MEHWTRVHGLLDKYYLNYIVEIQFSLFGGGSVYFQWSLVDVQCCVSFRCVAKGIYLSTGGIFRLFFPHIGHYSVFSRVLCAIQQVLISNSYSYVIMCICQPQSLNLSITYPLVAISMLSTSMTLQLWLVNKLVCTFFQIPHRYYMILFFLCLTSFNIAISRSIHVAANGIIFYFLWLIDILKLDKQKWGLLHVWGLSTPYMQKSGWLYRYVINAVAQGPCLKGLPCLELNSLYTILKLLTNLPLNLFFK